MYCPEGWHSTSGTAGEPATAICSTLLEAKWAGRDFPRNFNAYHNEHPVLWVIKVRRYTTVNNYRYCEPEMPAEYRPQLTLAELPRGELPGPSLAVTSPVEEHGQRLA